MELLQNFKKVIFSLDLFCSSELLRYKQGTQYKTLTGGLLSLGIIIVITLGFAGMIRDTFNKTSITSDLTQIRQTDPTQLTLTANAQNNFMFAISIVSQDTTYRYNLNSQSQARIFNIYIAYLQYQQTRFSRVSFIPLEACTLKHWNIKNQDASTFEQFGGSNTLCIPLDTNISLQGSFSSSYYTQAILRVEPCKNTSYDSSCAPQSQIDNLLATFGNFVIGVVYLNPVINPTQPNPISYYLELNDFSLFSSTISTQIWLQFSDYTINTDSSLLPFTDINTVRGAIAQSRSENYPMSGANNILAEVHLAKSANSLVYNREVQKISAVFSYIGGLVGAVTAFLFMLKSYTDSSLEITIGIDLFEATKNDKEPPGFNIFGFIKLSLYRILKLVRWKGEWKLPQKFEQYQQEAVKQLDIGILLKRLYLLQTCISHLIPKDQLERIMVEGEGITVKSARKMRTRHSIKSKQKNKETIEVEEYTAENVDKIEPSQIKETEGAFVSNVKEQSWFNLIQKQKKKVDFNEKPERNMLNYVSKDRKQINGEFTKIGNNLYQVAPANTKNVAFKQKDPQRAIVNEKEIQRNEGPSNIFKHQ